MAALVLWILLVMVTIAAVGRRLATYKRVTVQLVMGLLVIYVLVGVAFGLTYEMIEFLNPAAFAQGQQGISGAVYFSFVTLATLGYGDVSPGIDIMRSLAVAEAVDRSALSGQRRVRRRQPFGLGQRADPSRGSRMNLLGPVTAGALAWSWGLG